MKDSKRVLFIEHQLRNEKLGIMYLAAALKSKGHHADLVQADKEDLFARIEDYRPHFAAFSVLTGGHAKALKTAGEIKRKYGLPTIFGGPHCTFFPEFADYPQIDFLVTGAGEEAIVRIVEGHEPPGLVKGRIHCHPDALPFPDRSVFYQYAAFRDNPMKNVITSRACPYRCSYCFNHSYLALTKANGETQKWFQRRSVDNVLAEIALLRDRHGLEKVLFIDDCFIQDTHWLDTFITGYTASVGLDWLCSLRANRLDEALAGRLFDAGLSMVNYALESADPDVQQYLLNRGHIKNADIIRAIRLFNQFGIKARMQNMIGLPLANPLQDALNTLQFNVRHKVTDSWCSIFQPYPRTALGRYCLDHGFIADSQLNACAESFFDGSLLNIPDKKALYALQKLWYFIVDGNIPLDLAQILIHAGMPRRMGDSLQQLRFDCSRRRLYGLGAAEAAAPEAVDEKAICPEQDWGACDDRTLIKACLAGINLPAGFVDIVADLTMTAGDRNNMIRYLQGETVFGVPLNTVDDETGELRVPGDSIWRRGGTGDDIRGMRTEHFMEAVCEG